MSGLWVHRVAMILIAPLVWVMATIAYVVIAPLSAAETVWIDGIKKHWNDQ